MKRLIACILLLCLLLGCAKIVRKTPVDKRFTAAHSEIESYMMIIPNGNGGMQLVPMVHTVRKPERYEILYQIEYDDGTTIERWETVDRQTYESED